MTANFQLLMLSPNLLKSKNFFGRGFVENFLSFLTKIATAKKLILSTEWPRRTLCVRGTIKTAKPMDFKHLIDKLQLRLFGMHLCNGSSNIINNEEILSR